MSSSSRRAVDRSYHPRGGLGMSASLQRARAPFFYRNMIVGTIVAGFIVGVYSYSISAVKQDDFSDVEDLLPPLEQRQQMKSIEDEMREKGQNPYPTTPLSPNNPSSLSARSSKNADIPYSVSSASANSRGLPGQPGTSLGSSSTDLGDVAGRPRESWVMSLLPSRLDKSEWVQRRGWVEEGRGNVLVWGAPSVDNIGTVHDSKQTRGPRLV